MQITLNALDGSNNLVPSYGGTVHFSSSDPQAVLPANTTLSGGSGGFAVTLKTAGNQTITATDTGNGTITATTGPIAISAAATTHLALSAPTMSLAGASMQFTVTALDGYGNTAAYTGTIHFSSSDAGATLPANATLTNGTGTFNATLNTVGNQTISGTDTANNTIAGSTASIMVS